MTNKSECVVRWQHCTVHSASGQLKKLGTEATKSTGTFGGELPIATYWGLKASESHDDMMVDVKICTAWYKALAVPSKDKGYADIGSCSIVWHTSTIVYIIFQILCCSLVKLACCSLLCQVLSWYWEIRMEAVELSESKRMFWKRGDACVTPLTECGLYMFVLS